ncbi:MAG: DUF4837 family protein [Bacteroidetes bacterium]|jgi:hypothetical protein|nr:DUF4837 family protein [Bacteroidota bacterium]MDF1863572.1 DUF4837 family protein [Saprospiraceae bacterium]
MKILKNFIFLILSFVILFSGCAGEVPWQGPPTAFGQRNQVVVVSDKGVWESPIGDSVDFYFASPYLVLPQPEPILDLLPFTPEELGYDPVKKQLKTYVFIADMEDENSPTTQLIKADIGAEKLREVKETSGFGNNVGRNKWAQGQLLVYMYAFGKEKLIENVQKNASSIISRINKEEIKRVDATAYMGGENWSLGEEVVANFGVKLKIPVEYQKAVYDDKDQFLWIRRDTRDANTNIFIHKLKYFDQAQLSRDTMKSIRNHLGRYVSTDNKNSYMKINDVDLPMFIESKTIDNNYALEARGIWDMKNDFMGGPFISYLIHNPKKNELLFIDGFVHAPGEDKRDHMQELEYILQGIRM